MADPTFTIFTPLPPEIRRQIWQAVIRPDRPGVHHFEILKMEEPAEDDDPHAIDLPGSELFGVQGTDIWKTKPEQDPEDDAEDSKFRRIQRAKASSYISDAGLWSACSESRNTIRDHVDLVRFANIALYFEPGRHPYHFIRVDAKEDLFVLEMGKPFPGFDDWDDTIREMPCLDLDGYQIDAPGMKHAQVAFEFNTQWLEEVKHLTPPLALERISCM